MRTHCRGADTSRIQAGLSTTTRVVRCPSGSWLPSVSIRGCLLQAGKPKPDGLAVSGVVEGFLADAERPKRRMDLQRLPRERDAMNRRQLLGTVGAAVGAGLALGGAHVFADGHARTEDHKGMAPL